MSVYVSACTDVSVTEPTELEPCLARLGTTPEDKPSFLNQVNAIENVNELRRMVIQKERERQIMANDLDVAARLGLVISETNEAIQLKLAQLEEENHMLREELERLHLANVNYHRDSSTLESLDHWDSQLVQHALERVDEPQQNQVNDRIHLTQELEQARRELVKFRKEMDSLSSQLNDMASEMINSKERVSMYAKRLAEVEHKLATTREMNTNLQLLLEKALTSQKQSSSNTSHLVKNIQNDLSRVVAENDQLRARIADLENQQIESKERLAAMVAQAKKYASLLEQAQDTIHNLSEPRLFDDDTMSNGLSTSSTVSFWEGTKETEITKGPVFSAEFRHEMQKEIERNLNIRNDIRRRIVTNESIISDRKKTLEGLKSILSDRETGGSNSTMTGISSSPNSSSQTPLASLLKKDPGIQNDESRPTHHLQTSGTDPITIKSTSLADSSATTATSQAPTSANAIGAFRPASFLTGFGSFGSDSGLGGLGPTSFITRGISTRAFTAVLQDEPSISTRFFRRLATRFESQQDS